MKDDIKLELDSVLDSYERSTKRGAEGTNRKKEGALAFVEEFYRIRESIIWPTMLEVGELLSKKGHDTRVDQTDDDLDPSGTGVEGSITMFFYPYGIGFDSSRANDYPFIRFVASRYSSAVWLHVNTWIPGRKVTDIGFTPGSSGPRGEYPLEALTAEFVQREVVSVVKEVFR